MNISMDKNQSSVGKVSIITVVLNNRSCIENCIQSIIHQTYPNIEYIIIDGGSSDGTIDVIRKHEKTISTWISEPDRGIYDAMNKGITRSNGDVIGILNSDDLYADERVIEKVMNCFSRTQSDSCYGDLIYVERNNINKNPRYWKSNNYRKENFKLGWMPPHPTFFVRHEIYEKYGAFNLNFPLAADYELMLRFLYKEGISASYIPEVLVKMRTGGNCRPGLVNTLNNMAENYRAWKVNGLKLNPLTFVLKPLSKTVQYLSASS